MSTFKRKRVIKGKGGQAHNKSGLQTLSLLQLSDDELNELHTTLMDTMVEHEFSVGCCRTTCWRTQLASGKVHYKGRKYDGYAIIAWMKFGRNELLKVKPNKVSTEKRLYI